jgi:DUF218 domain-containing protein
MSLLKSACDHLVVRNTRCLCDLIIVLAGRPERKEYGWELFGQQLAPRLIFSVGRYEVRQTANAPTRIPKLLELRDKTLPEHRHFWVDFFQTSRTASLAEIKKPGTFWELHALAEYLAPDVPWRIAIVSTAIHLRRVRFCCEKISAFRNSSLVFLAVPEDRSSFRQDKWWKHPDHWSYLINEYLKLAGYHLRYRQTHTAG